MAGKCPALRSCHDRGRHSCRCAGRKKHAAEFKHRVLPCVCVWPRQSPAAFLIAARQSPEDIISQTFYRVHVWDRLMGVLSCCGHPLFLPLSPGTLIHHHPLICYSERKNQVWAPVSDRSYKRRGHTLLYSKWPVCSSRAAPASHFVCVCIGSITHMFSVSCPVQPVQSLSTSGSKTTTQLLCLSPLLKLITQPSSEFVPQASIF